MLTRVLFFIRWAIISQMWVCKSCITTRNYWSPFVISLLFALREISKITANRMIQTEHKKKSNECNFRLCFKWDVSSLLVVIFFMSSKYRSLSSKNIKKNWSIFGSFSCVIIIVGSGTHTQIQTHLALLILQAIMITTRTQKMCWRCALYHIALTIANRFVSPLFRFGSISSSSCHHSTYKSVFRWLNQRFVRIIVVFLTLSMRTNRNSFLFSHFLSPTFFFFWIVCVLKCPWKCDTIVKCTILWAKRATFAKTVLGTKEYMKENRTRGQMKKKVNFSLCATIIELSFEEWRQRNRHTVFAKNRIHNAIQ